jgi:hypothetical protein
MQDRKVAHDQRAPGRKVISLFLLPSVKLPVKLYPIPWTNEVSQPMMVLELT